MYGPTTHSRANVVPTKDATEKKANNPIHEEPTNIQLPESNVRQGSMGAFLAMRKRKKENAKKAAVTENAPVSGKVDAKNSLPL